MGRLRKLILQIEYVILMEQAATMGNIKYYLLNLK